MLRSAGFLIYDIYWFQEDLGGDKATHVWMSMAVSFALWLLLAGRWRMRWIVVLATLLLLADEISQFWLPRRNFSLEDFAMGLAGVAVVSGLILACCGMGYSLGLRIREEGASAGDE